MSDESIRINKDVLLAQNLQNNAIAQITVFAVSIRSQDQNVQIPALKGILDIVVNEPESVESLFDNNIIVDLNKIISSDQEGEVFVLSSAILHIVGVRSKSVDIVVRAKVATDSIIQIINSTNEKQSKAASKALCDLVEANEQIRNSLLTTGFIQVVLHTFTVNTQIQTKSSSSSQSTSNDNVIPGYVKVGLLNVILKLTEEEGGLESLGILIPILEEMKRNGEEQIKSKAKKILNQLNGEGIQSYSTLVNNEKEKDDQIKQLENTNKLQVKQLIRADEEKEQVKAENEGISTQLQRTTEEKERLRIELQRTTTFQTTSKQPQHLMEMEEMHIFKKEMKMAFQILLDNTKMHF
ncbi:MAG: hypothetical protein EZS28_036450, partial [Streblomastix strix]